MNGPDSNGSIGRPLGPYRILDTRRRWRAGVVYLAMAIAAAATIGATATSAMWLTAVLPIVTLAVYQFAGSWRMTVGDVDAITIASDATSFSVGHGSATLGYRGFLAMPVWQVLVFADTPSPDRQALVTVDARTGAVTGRYEETVEVP